jgi:hypothetical protein
VAPLDGLHQAICTDEEVDKFMDICLQNFDQAMCDMFQMDSGPCVDCLLSGPMDNKYGPMTVYEMPVVLYENPGQCISSIEKDDSDMSCGAKVFFDIQCQVTACAQCTYEDGEFQKLLDCFAAARADSCKDYADAADACTADLLAQNVAIDVCLPGDKNFFTYLTEMSKLFCGP